MENKENKVKLAFTGNGRYYEENIPQLTSRITNRNDYDWIFKKR